MLKSMFVWSKKERRKLVSIFNPAGSKMLKILFSDERMKDEHNYMDEELLRNFEHFLPDPIGIP